MTWSTLSRVSRPSSATRWPGSRPPPAPTPVTSPARPGCPLVVLEVAARADDGHLRALADVRSGADALDAFGYGANVLLRGSRFHHDHHLAGPFGRSPSVGTLPSEVLRQKRR